MWTICWTGGEEKDGWDRFETREDVINFANTLVREGDVCEEDILIFSPEADSYTVSYDELEENTESELAKTIRIACGSCNCALVWENEAAGVIQTSSEYLGDNWPVCRSCMIEHCIHANCLACNFGKYPDCRFLKLKSEYLRGGNKEIGF